MCLFVLVLVLDDYRLVLDVFAGNRRLRVRRGLCSWRSVGRSRIAMFVVVIALGGRLSVRFDLSSCSGVGRSRIVVLLAIVALGAQLSLRLGLSS